MPAQLIGFSGKSLSGKDTAAKNLKNLFSKEFEIKKFADKLKHVASLMLNVPVEKFEDELFKDSFMPSEWDQDGKQMTYRDFLQLLGTDAIRLNLHPNAWVNSLFSEYTNDSNWMITDVRFPNELEMIKKMGGVVIRIERDLEYRYPILYSEYLSSGKFSECTFEVFIELNYPKIHRKLIHYSETALDDKFDEFNMVIYNNKSIELLKEVYPLLKNHFKIT